MFPISAFHVVIQAMADGEGDQTDADAASILLSMAASMHSRVCVLTIKNEADSYHHMHITSCSCNTIEVGYVFD